MPVRVETARFLAGFTALEGKIVQAAARGIHDGIRAAESSGKGSRLFNDRSGATRQSIRGTYGGTGRGSVVFGGASRLLNSGTRPHVIQGRPMLRFQVNGTTFFRRMVHHPGTAPRPFVDEARAVGAEVARVSSELYVNEIVRRA